MRLLSPLQQRAGLQVRQNKRMKPNRKKIDQKGLE
jgi:hypothetical protein